MVSTRELLQEIRTAPGADSGIEILALLQSPVPGKGSGKPGQFLGSFPVSAVQDFKGPRPTVPDIRQGLSDSIPVQGPVRGKPMLVIGLLAVHVLKVRAIESIPGEANLLCRVFPGSAGMSGVNDQPDTFRRIAVN